MGKFVLPEAYILGFTQLDHDELRRYLRDSDNEAFLEDVEAALADGVSPGEVLCSFFAKLCYKSLTKGKNLNVTKTREIADNIRGCFDQGHLSVFEHANINLLVTNCSRILTHEQVRHRVGVAYSQTSGRYVRLDTIDLVVDPILEPAYDLVKEHLWRTEEAVYLMECALGLRVPPAGQPRVHPRYCINLRSEGYPEEADAARWVPNDDMPFDRKKKLTSAIRRIAPNGQANEIGITVNIRSLRHMIQMRTAPGAEWEIRYVFARIYELVRARFPLLFYKARVKVVDGLPWVHGMKMQPYEQEWREE